MKTALLINDTAGSASALGDAAWALTRELGWDVSPFGDAPVGVAARRAVESGYEMVIAGGGDGTVREVVQGVWEGAQLRAGPPALFGVLPLGTGNDLARALRMPLEPEAAIRALAGGADAARTITMDLLELSHGRGGSVCANSVNGGIAPLISEQLDQELKAKLGPLAFIWGALGTLKQLERWEVRFRLDGGPILTRSCVAFVVANGGSVGGGVQVAPVAKLDDGRFDLVVVQAEATIAELTIAAIQAKFGDLFASDCVEHFTGQSLELVELPPSLGFSIDGEALEEPLRGVRVLPGALRTVVGAQ